MGAAFPITAYIEIRLNAYMKLTYNAGLMVKLPFLYAVVFSVFLYGWNKISIAAFPLGKSHWCVRPWNLAGSGVCFIVLCCNALLNYMGRFDKIELIYIFYVVYLLLNSFCKRKPDS